VVADWIATSSERSRDSPLESAPAPTRYLLSPKVLAYNIHTRGSSFQPDDSRTHKFRATYTLEIPSSTSSHLDLWPPYHLIYGNHSSHYQKHLAHTRSCFYSILQHPRVIAPSGGIGIAQAWAQGGQWSPIIIDSSIQTMRGPARDHFTHD
jgi:hypothetical protein